MFQYGCISWICCSSTVTMCMFKEVTTARPLPAVFCAGMYGNVNINVSMQVPCCLTSKRTRYLTAAAGVRSWRSAQCGHVRTKLVFSSVRSNIEKINKLSFADHHPQIWPHLQFNKDHYELFDLSSWICCSYKSVCCSYLLFVEVKAGSFQVSGLKQEQIQYS